MKEMTKAPRWLRKSKEYSHARGVIIGMAILGIFLLLIGGAILDANITEHIQLKNSVPAEPQYPENYPHFLREYEQDRLEKMQESKRSTVAFLYLVSGTLLAGGLLICPAVIISRVRILKKLREHSDWYRFYKVNPVGVEISSASFRRNRGTVVTAEARFRTVEGEKVRVELRQDLPFWETVSVDEVRKMHATVGYNSKTKQTLTYEPDCAPKVDSSGWPVPGTDEY